MNVPPRGIEGPSNPQVVKVATTVLLTWAFRARETPWYAPLGRDVPSGASSPSTPASSANSAGLPVASREFHHPVRAPGGAVAGERLLEPRRVTGDPVPGMSYVQRPSVCGLDDLEELSDAIG